MFVVCAKNTALAIYSSMELAIQSLKETKGLGTFKMKKEGKHYAEMSIGCEEFTVVELTQEKIFTSPQPLFC